MRRRSGAVLRVLPITCRRTAVSNKRVDEMDGVGEAAPARLDIELVDTFEGCRRIRDEWLSLRETASSHAPNSDPDRFIAVTSVHENARPYVLVVWDGPRLEGLLVGRFSLKPLVCRIGYFRFKTYPLRSVDVVYGGILAATGDRAIRALCGHMLAMLSAGHVDHVQINHLRVDNPAFSMLKGLAWAEFTEPHYIRRLVPGSIGQTLARHSSAHRAKIRRYDRLLCEAFNSRVELRCFRRPDDVGGFLSLVSPLAERTYQHTLAVAVHDTPLWRSVLSVESEKGRMQSYVLMANGRPIAYQNGVIYGSTYYCDGRGYDSELRDLRPGNVLSHRIAEELCACGCDCIDYGFGDAEYKRVYGTDKWEETSLQLHGHSARARAARFLIASSRRVAGALATVSKSLGVEARLKKGWRSRLRKPSSPNKIATL